MSPEQFLKEFGHLAETEGGVTRIRQLVLSSALSGRLGLGESSDGAMGGVLRRYGHSPVHAEAVPDRWAMVTLPMIAEQRLGKMLDAAKNKGQLRPYLRNLNVQWFRFELDDVLEMRLEDNEVEEFMLNDGDLLVCEGGEPGRAAIWRDTGIPMFFQKALHRIRPIPEVLPQFLAYRFRLDAWTGKLAELFTGATIKHLTGRSLKSHQFPVPPLAEQKRIVEKVDQLMALCDELEAKQKQKREKAVAFNQAALNAVVHASDKAALASSWSRLQDHFEVLYELPENVKQLRETVLVLAFSGRLFLPHEEGLADAGDGLRRRVRGWDIETVGKLASVIDPNPSHRYPSYTNGEVPLLSTREFDLDWGWALERQQYKLVPKDVHLEQVERCRFADSDIVFARKGRLGLARRPPSLGAYCFSHTLFVIKPRPQVDSDYLMWHLRRRDVEQWLREEMNSNTGVPTLGKAVLERLPVALPPLQLQREVVAGIVRLWAVCDHLERTLSQQQSRGERLMKAIVDAIIA